MGKKAELFISESLSDLKQALSKEKNQIGKRRIQSLIFIKEEKFETRQHLADYLCIHIRTLEKWLVRYKSKVFQRWFQFIVKVGVLKKWMGKYTKF